MDVENDTTAIFAEAERRFGDSTVVEIQARIFTNADPGDPSAFTEQDDFINISLQRHF